MQGISHFSMDCLRVRLFFAISQFALSDLYRIFATLFILTHRQGTCLKTWRAFYACLRVFCMVVSESLFIHFFKINAYGSYIKQWAVSSGERNSIYVHGFCLGRRDVRLLSQPQSFCKSCNLTVFRERIWSGWIIYFIRLENFSSLWAVLVPISL